MEVIIISAHGDMDTVIKAMRLGAFDYLRKPFRFIDMQIALERTQISSDAAKVEADGRKDSDSARTLFLVFVTMGA